jgi:hypothetical protein
LLLAPVVINLTAAERTLKACSEIVGELIAAYDAGRSVNLNVLKANLSAKNALKTQPRLVEIIAAIPDKYRDALLPRLRAKPVRTASGVCILAQQRSLLPTARMHRALAWECYIMAHAALCIMPPLTIRSQSLR